MSSSTASPNGLWYPSRRHRPAAARHPPSATPIPMFVVLLLVLHATQYAAQPIVTRELVQPTCNKMVLVGACEVMKIVLCTCMLLGTGQWQEATAGWDLKHSFKIAGVLHDPNSDPLQGLPAAVLAVQGTLIQQAYLNLDSVSFNMVNQSKMIFTALFLYWRLGRPQTHLQSVALAMVTVGTMIASWPSESAASTPDALTSDRLFYGALPALVAAVCSGFTSVQVQVALQSSSTPRNSLFLTIELAMYTVAILTLSAVLSGVDESASEHACGGYSLVPSLLNALGGMLVGLVIKHAGALHKGLATATGIVLTGFFERLWSGAVQLHWSRWAAVPIVIGGVGSYVCLLYTSDAADEEDSVDLGGRRLI
eukprot:TRINITY_DN6577_c0_g1_i1.p1 TRINITY_DN6577_c0_g1~~TRINITY_DN6577_c0_g1_i1.p1  ORF type:complete len:367 (+),score=77.35 TRINITY_DN6577_c0_g1_i1:88-1188(+)